jgi:hypothetical protein
MNYPLLVVRRERGWPILILPYCIETAEIREHPQLSSVAL